MIGLLLVLVFGLALLTPAFVVLFVKLAQRRHWKAPRWLKALAQTLRVANTVLYASAFLVLLVMAIWLMAHSK